MQLNSINNNKIIVFLGIFASIVGFIAAIAQISGYSLKDFSSRKNTPTDSINSPCIFLRIK